jgi:hypothetical protein
MSLAGLHVSLLEQEYDHILHVLEYMSTQKKNQTFASGSFHSQDKIVPGLLFFLWSSKEDRIAQRAIQCSISSP